MKPDEMIKLLKKEGWQHVRTTGSHHIFKKPGNPNNLAVPRHSKDLPKGTENQIRRKAGI